MVRVTPELNPGTFRAWRRGVVGIALGCVLLSGCGAANRPATTSAVPDELEPATVRGLAAAVFVHVEGEPRRGGYGGQNEDEGWMNVSTTILSGDEEVPLDAMVVLRDGTREMADQACREEGAWILSCEATSAADGSPLVMIASTEDITGGRSRHGFFAFVMNYRPGEVVLVVEELSSRKSSYVDLTALPVDLDVLTEIATDPLVGSRTTPEMNQAGAELADFSD